MHCKLCNSAQQTIFSSVEICAHQNLYNMSTIQLNNFSLEEMSVVMERVVRKVLSETESKSNSSFENEILLTRKDVARILQIHITTVHNWTKSGKLKAYKIEGRVGYLPSELQQCLTPVRPQQS